MKFKRGDRIMIAAEITAVHQDATGLHAGYEIRIDGDLENEVVDVGPGIETEAIKLRTPGDPP